MVENISEELFGRIKEERIKATGGHVPDVKLLQKIPKKFEAVISIFCEGCGTYLRAVKEQAEDFADKAKVDLPEDLTNFYFEVGGCEECDGNQKIVKLKKI